MSMKALDTNTLVELSERAAEKFSRSLDPAVYERLDPDGWHLLEKLPVWQPFDRCKLTMKFKDSEKPEASILDVSHEDYRLLPNAEDLAKLADSCRECSSCGQVRPHEEDDYLCIACRTKA
jgi:hypothetical protein